MPTWSQNPIGDFRQDAPRDHERSGSLIAVRDFLQSHVTETVSLYCLSKVSGLSRFHLCRAFHIEYGLSPHQYQLELRIKLGSKLLAAGTGPLEAALESGFSSQSHFSRHFKRVLGITPGRYRAQFCDRRPQPPLLE